MQVKQQREHNEHMKRAQIIKIKQIKILLEWGNATLTHCKYECIKTHSV